MLGLFTHMRLFLTSCLTISTFAFWCLTLSGCAAAHRRATTSAPASPVIVGEVALVDEQKRFVLIDLESNLYVPPPGTPLRTTNAAGETGRLVASPEQKRPFVAAEIRAGDPAVGDRVLQ